MPTSLLCGAAPVSHEIHWGFFVIPQGEQWTIVDGDGRHSAVAGPKTLRCFGEKLTQRRAVVANETEYIEIRFVDGHSEVTDGPAAVFENPLEHVSVQVKHATSIQNNEALIVYREELDGKATFVNRAVIRGPKLYKPSSASEWQHSFVWHGHDPSGDSQGLCRKRPRGIKFDKILLAPMSTYYDVENVRTADDALLTVRLMIFFQVTAVEQLLDATNDPIADIVNSVSADVIGFCSARSFEQFKEAAEQLNMLGIYQGLVQTMSTRGVEVSKVVFRGFLAPQRLQKMHDDAIERRTKLVLERESEIQEQQLRDERLAKEEEREKMTRAMEKAQALHQAEMQRTKFEAKQRESREQAEQETAMMTKHHEAELAHLSQLHSRLGLQSAELSSLLVAKAHSPAKLIQVTGDARANVQIRDA